MAFFLLGAVGYPLLECLWRGYSHWSMAIAGGICAVLLGCIGKLSLTIVEKALLGCIAITAVEFLVGCIVNLRFKMNVWDYTALPFNLMGQICLRFCVIWFGLSLALFALMKTAKLHL